VADYPLYGGFPPHENTPTSIEAAARIKDIAPTLREAVHRFIYARGKRGATDDEVEMYLKLRHQSASARRRELVQLHQVFDSGTTRNTRSGRKATVWIVQDPEMGEDTRKWYQVVKGIKTGKMFLMCDYHRPQVERQILEHNESSDETWSLHQVGDGTTGMKLCFLCEKASKRG